ncbi:MAG: GAF domain-containing protein, partial [Bacteroidota bacterium]
NGVMEYCGTQIEFPLLGHYLMKSATILERLEAGKYVSNDESQIVELLTHEIHPLLHQLFQEFSQLDKSQLQTYLDYLDEDLGIVYRRRKDYEDSVGLLNRAIANYIEKDNRERQKILPHFFEKYTTDGVEYNIYLGQALLQHKKFSEYFLKDFRLWQLIQMCELTRLVERVSKELPVPLTTAQLIFVFNNTLSIHFHMDEKQFEVDGAYNVRYEIMKKRIDKALVKGTKERLTQKGKIAIVWLQDRDRQEYMDYLNHLVQRGYVMEDIEDLELEKLQGVHGLRALRVQVIL